MPGREEMLKAGIDPEPYVAHDIDWYDGSIRGMDAEMGRLASGYGPSTSKGTPSWCSCRTTARSSSSTDGRFTARAPTAS